MNDIADLYQELIVDHSARPRNFGPLSDSQSAEGYNPLCGDRMLIHVRMEGDVVADARFQGDGCAISKASASLMTESIKGKTTTEIEKLFSEFHNLVTGAGKPNLTVLGKLAAFAGLKEFPMRVKCGTLAWHTLRAALKREPIAATE